MAASITTPTLTDLGSSNWVAFIPGYEELTLKLTKFKIPAVNAGLTPIGNRTEYILQAGGDHIQFDNLELEFIVDEHLLNYIKIYQWMRGNMRSVVEESASICVHFLSNDKRFQDIQIEFYEAFPISLDELDFDTDGHETNVHCSVTFAYTAFDFVDRTDRDAVPAIDL